MFRNCTSAGNGGAILVQYVLPTIVASLFHSCIAGYYTSDVGRSGGAVYVILCDVSSLYVNASSVRIDANEFASNAADWGGSVYYYGHGDISFAHNTLSGGTSPLFDRGSDVCMTGTFDASAMGSNFASSCSSSSACRVTFGGTCMDPLIPCFFFFFFF
jgi:hypothetical protein